VALFLPCLFPLFHIARLYLDERRAWWVLIFFVAEPLVFINAGKAATDGFSLALAVWFLYCGVKLVREPGIKWLVPACASGSLVAVSKLPFFMVAGLALFFLTLWQSGFDFKRLGFLATAGGVAGVAFLLWTHYTDALQDPGDDDDVLVFWGLALPIVGGQLDQGWLAQLDGVAGKLRSGRAGCARVGGQKRQSRCPLPAGRSVADNAGIQPSGTASLALLPDVRPGNGHALRGGTGGF
jgi:4-amino-4-deoxy-L-arabinose transferase-like glycosyltransferase